MMMLGIYWKLKQRLNHLLNAVIGPAPIGALILIHICAISAWADTSQVTVLRNNAQLRKGPASYYEVLAIIPENTGLSPLGQSMGWYKVSHAGQSGFISAKVTQPLVPKEDVFSQMAGQTVNIELSKHGISAGAKGFADRFSRRIKGDPALTAKLAAYRLDPSVHKAFAADTYQQADAGFYHQQVPPPTEGVRSAYSNIEQGLGMSIAGKIGSQKVMEDPALTRYINQVGHLVVAASLGFDLPFAFFVIDDPKTANAYACPGGYIFVTRGLLGLMRDEAELAVVLAHEIAHVTHQHGLQEIERRRPLIVADNAFAELDQETGDTADDKWKAIEADLDQFALDAYETIFQGRLSRYELDADRIGLTYAARSGYDPKAMLVLLQRLKKNKMPSGNAHYTSHDIEQRLKGINLALSGFPSHGKYFRYADRWRRHTTALR